MQKKEYGPLYSLASNGKTKEWSCKVVEENGVVNIYYIHGYTDGKKITDTKSIIGKNIGKSNESSPWEQANSDAQSKMKKKMDEGYQETIITNIAEVTIELPMLAQKYTERKKYLKFPCQVQPKLNGVRCIAKGGKYISRKGKDFTTLSHLDKEIKLFHKEVKANPDGEIFNPEWGFQEIIRALKKQRDHSNELEYWIYDLVDTTSKFSEREAKINKFFDVNSTSKNELGFRKVGNLVEVPTHIVTNEKDIKRLHKEFTKAGFEGSILRNSDGLYLLNHRSNDLLKFKDFLDSDYTIIGGHEGTGNDIGTIVFECETEDGKPFSVRPKGSREQRREWLEQLDEIVKQKIKLITRYQNLSEDGIPIFPVGIALRDFE
jgi:DNA ligase-1